MEFTIVIKFTDRPAEVKTFTMSNVGSDEVRHNAKSTAGRIYKYAPTVKSVRVTDQNGRSVLYISKNAKRMVNTR
jgi:hypothetical protein